MALDKVLGARRLMGVDLARGVALVGMMATHIVPSVGTDGSVTWAYTVASGRASALFAVLAGISLVLSTRAAKPADRQAHEDGTRLAPGARRGVLARAAIIGLVGLTLGVLGSGVAVILVNYAVLFVIGAALLAVPTRVLGATAVAWLLVAPVAAHALRSGLPPGPGAVTSWLSFADPVELVTTLLLTGYYPVLQWTGYLLVGMTVARLPLRDRAVHAWLLGGGAVLAGGAKVASDLLLGPGGGYGRLTVPPGSVIAGRDLDTVLQTGIYGTTPTTTWWWLAVSGPHSGTPFDLLHTTGTSLVLLGACLLLAGAVGRAGRLALVPLAAAGSMTFTLYTAHVVVLAATRGATSGPAAWAPTAWWGVHAVAALVIGSLWLLTPWKGPLEALASEASAAARESGSRAPAAPY